MDKQVVVYTQTFDCVFCDRVKEFLSQKGVPYIERDVNTDDRAKEELEQMGYVTTPVVLVDGEAVVGFDRARLERLLS
jgi:glutaredoxin